MQVNSAQDYLTKRKRQIISATYYTTPPQQKDKFYSAFLSTVANNNNIERFILPTVSAWGSVPGTASYTNNCTGCSTSTGAVGTFDTVNTKNANILVRDLTLSMS